MSEKYFATYMEGREKPIGTLTEEMVEGGVLEEMSKFFGKKLYAKPITPKQRDKIVEDITHSESLDALFAEIERERGE